MKPEFWIILLGGPLALVFLTACVMWPSYSRRKAAKDEADAKIEAARLAGLRQK